MKTSSIKIICGTLLFSVILIIPQLLLAAHLHPETWYVDIWCQDHNGTVEYRLPDATRVDCLTSKNAVELDFADKWYEAVGQSLHYGKMTKLRPGIVLIIETEADLKYWNRLLAIKKYWGLPITLWKYTPAMAGLPQQ